MCYHPYFDDEEDEPVLLFKEPEVYLYRKVVEIVYAEVKTKSMAT